MNKEILVSVICNTYNHENYIRDALESFIVQKTEFPFEILVHDDASTDRTPQIIAEYTEKYPNLIKPYFQQENQYSKGVRVTSSFQYPRAKGEFFAICEGDDYWTDEYKLQKQTMGMINNPEVDVCAHKAIKIREGKTVGIISPRNESCIIPVEEVILGGGGYVATSSLMFRRDSIMNETPMQRIISLDYVSQIQGALRGGMLYLNDEMSAYRLNSYESWSTRMGRDKKNQIDHIKTIEEMLLCLNEYTENRYSDAIKKKIRMNTFSSLYVQSKYKEMLQKEYDDIYTELPYRRQLKIRLKYIMSLIKIDGKNS